MYLLSKLEIVQPAMLENSGGYLHLHGLFCHQTYPAGSWAANPQRSFKLAKNNGFYHVLPNHVFIFFLQMNLRIPQQHPLFQTVEAGFCSLTWIKCLTPSEFFMEDCNNSMNLLGLLGLLCPWSPNCCRMLLYNSLRFCCKTMVWFSEMCLKCLIYRWFTTVKCKKRLEGKQIMVTDQHFRFIG